MGIMIRDRREEIAAEADNIEKGLFAAQCRRLEKEYQNEMLRDKVKEVFGNLFQKAIEKEKEVAWLGICFLNTSLVTKSYEVILSLYNQDFYFDQEPIEVYWRPPMFAEYFDDDMKMVINALREKFPGLRQYEETCVRKTCVEYYYAAFSQLCITLRDDIGEIEEFYNMKKANHFTTFFGQYRGEGEILWRIKE